MPTFDDFDRVWFLTWTTYGTWLPGDRRGFVSPKFEGLAPERRNNAVGVPYDRARPELRQLVMANLKGPPVYLTAEQAQIVRVQFEETARFRGWTIAAGAVMSNHVHLLVGVSGDPEPANLMRDYKSYASRTLNRQFSRPESGTWWTEQGSKRKITSPRHFDAVTQYAANQNRPLTVWPVH